MNISTQFSTRLVDLPGPQISNVIKKAHSLGRRGKAADSQTQEMVTFALIVSAHPYCARKFTGHVMHERAR